LAEGRISYPPIPYEKDRRKKLTNDEKEVIRNLKDEYSSRQLAAKFGVSRRTIQFILDPKKLEANLQRRRERISRGERQETREARREYMRRFRNHQKEVNGDAYYIWEKSIDPRRNRAKNHIFNREKKGDDGK